MKFRNLLQKPAPCQGEPILKIGFNSFLFSIFRYPESLEIPTWILRAKESVMPAM